MNNELNIGTQVVGTTGDKKGELGQVIAIDNEKQRVQVKWPKGFCKTWVKISSLK
jgi:ribosomal protein L24